MSANRTQRASMLGATVRTLAAGQQALGDSLERLYQSLRHGDVAEIDRAVRETQRHAQECERHQRELESQQVAVGARSLYALLATMADAARANSLLGSVERLALELGRVADIQHDLAQLTSGLIGINQEMIAAVSQQARSGPVYDAHSSQRPARINTRLVDASA